MHRSRPSGGAGVRRAAAARRDRAADRELRNAESSARHRRAAARERAVPCRARGGRRLIDKLAIIGVGLIGGSLARALRAAGEVREVVGYGRTVANLDEA